MLLITHYTRILRYIKPDFVHVFVGGRIVEEGGPELADLLENEGYERFTGVGGRMRPRCTASTSRPIRADFPSWPGGCATASRWSTWTPARPRRSRVQVLDAVRRLYERHNAAVHRGTHLLAEEATDAVRGRPGQGRGVHRAPGRTRWCSPRTPPRRSTWSPTR